MRQYQGLTKVLKKSKITKSKGFGAWFWGLLGFGGGYKVGVQTFWRVRLRIFDLKYEVQLYLIKGDCLRSAL